MAPAIALAARRLRARRGRHRPVLARRPTAARGPAAAAHLPEARRRAATRPATGSCRRTSRGRCERSPQDGADGFYKGASPLRSSRRARPAKAASSRKPTSTQYRPRELAPVECDYRGYARRVRAAAELGRRRRSARCWTCSKAIRSRELGFHSAQAVHYQIEAMRHAYVDRNSELGDPDFVENPLDRLLRQGIRREDPRRRSTRPRPASRQISTPASAPHEGSNTTHYSIVDKDGNAVAVTYTLNDWFGAGVTAPRHRRPAQRRDGRLHREARRAEPVRTGAGRGATRSRPASARSAR